ncbi:MAG: hypothetical protein K6E95_03775 [Lachnospiraceae bacterium]|nr:hypothetical protein [Lachnospiraceae bacterium]
MGIGTNLLASVTGNPVLGVITIVDARKFEKTEVGKPTEIKTKKGFSLAGLDKAISNAVSTGLSAMPIDPRKLLANGKNPFPKDACLKQFEVQFNPSTITIQAQGGGMSQVTNVGRSTKDKEKGAMGSISYQTLDPRITVTIPLIFDRVVNSEAFLQDKLSLAPTSIAKTAFATFFSGGEVSVQTQVEGLIAVLRSDYTREIMFSWADMSYHGLINGVNAQYTMFSPTGKPLRAVVNLTILCSDTKIVKGCLGQWEDRYRDAFVNDELGKVISNSTVGQAAGSLINLG